MYQGDEIHGEVSSADASGSGVAFAIYPSGSTGALTVGDKDYVVIHSITSLMSGSLTGLVAADSDDDGERVAPLPAGGQAVNLSPPFICPMGVTPKLIASGAGQADVVIQGHLQRS